MNDDAQETSRLREYAATAAVAAFAAANSIVPEPPTAMAVLTLMAGIIINHIKAADPKTAPADRLRHARHARASSTALLAFSATYLLARILLRILT